ncbi:MAG: hypothetical protein HOG79_11050, partial [Prolixibacteraceae bacterium]|nr:hypothetical protein [Prolixibacteraceae bacterium]
MKVFGKILFNISLTFFMLLSAGVFAKSVRVNSVESFEKAQKLVNSGDSVVWEGGKFYDVNMKLTTNNIFFVAENPGETTFSGSSTLEISGNGNTVSGFQFVDGEIKGEVIDIFGSENNIQQINIKSYDSHFYLR